MMRENIYDDLNSNALMLANRLKKNLRKLKNWRKINKNIYTPFI